MIQYCWFKNVDYLERLKTPLPLNIEVPIFLFMNHFFNSENLKKMKKLKEFKESKELIQFFQEKGILIKECECEICKNKVSLQNYSKFKEKKIFKCSKCKGKTKSILFNSFFLHNST